MAECDYCGQEISKTKGKLLILNNGAKRRFCGSKCEKNWEKGRSHDYPEKEE
ncbi:MAG: hypothetical protein ABEJ93_02860 [Candidatus Nanohalobium sp.]